MLLSGSPAPCCFDLVFPFFVFVWFVEKCNKMIVYLFIITLKQFCSKIGNGFVQNDNDKVIDMEAEDLDDPGVAANELLEEVGEYEDFVLGDAERDLDKQFSSKIGNGFV